MRRFSDTARRRTSTARPRQTRSYACRASRKPLRRSKRSMPTWKRRSRNFLTRRRGLVLAYLSRGCLRTGRLGRGGTKEGRGRLLLRRVMTRPACSRQPSTEMNAHGPLLELLVRQGSRGFVPSIMRNDGCPTSYPTGRGKEEKEKEKK